VHAQVSRGFDFGRPNDFFGVPNHRSDIPDIAEIADRNQVMPGSTSATSA
jgi:hypothetical protein